MRESITNLSRAVNVLSRKWCCAISRLPTNQRVQEGKGKGQLSLCYKNHSGKIHVGITQRVHNLLIRLTRWRAKTSIERKFSHLNPEPEDTREKRCDLLRYLTACGHENFFRFDFDLLVGKAGSPKSIELIKVFVFPLVLPFLCSPNFAALMCS